MTLRNRCRPTLELLEGRDAPANLTVSYSAATHTLTVVGDGAGNILTIQGDATDQTHFILTSTSDTIQGSSSPFASSSGVQNIVVKMLAGGDTVSFGNSAPVNLLGSLIIDGGDGANTLNAIDLTVGKGLTIRNGNNSGASADFTELINLNVGGAFTMANGDGDSNTFVHRSKPGISTVRGAVSIINGSGADINYLSDLNYGGNVTVRNGHAQAGGGFAGATQFYNSFNTISRSQVKGSISVSYLDGTVFGEGVFDMEVGGNVTYAYGSGGSSLNIDGSGLTVPVLVHGNLSVTGTGTKSVNIGVNAAKTGLIVGKNFTVTGGPAADTVSVNKMTVGGTTKLALGDGANTVSIDDSLFAGTFTLTTGAGVDTVKLDTLTGSSAATTFDKAVRLNLGAGVDSVTLTGPDPDANQALVFLSTFVVHHGAEGEGTVSFGKDVYPFGGGLQWLI